MMRAGLTTRCLAFRDTFVCTPTSLIFRKIKISFLMRARASATVVQGGDLTPFYLWSPPLGGAAQSAFFLDPAEERGDDPVWADESSGRVRGMAVKMTPLPRLK